MATTPITKNASPTNMTGWSIANTGAFFNAAPWNTAVPSGAGNGVTFAFNKYDLILLGNPTNTEISFTVLTPEPEGYTQYGLTIGNVTIGVAGEYNECKMTRVSPLFKDSTNNVTVEANAAGGYIAVIQG